MDFSSGYTLLANVLSHWPIDWILIGAFAAFAALDGIRSGPTRATSLMLSLPAALLLVANLPDALFIGALVAQFSTPLAHAGVFAIVTAVLFFVIHRSIFAFSNGLAPLQALIAGVAAAIVLVVVWLQVPGLEAVWNFGDQVQAVFGGAYRFWWLAGSYIALATVRN